MRHIPMKGFLLLIFSLVTGDQEFGCKGGWVNFTCKNTNHLNFSQNKMRTFKDETKHFTVVRNLQEDDAVTICTRNVSRKLRIEDCGDQMKHTAFINATTTIICRNTKIKQTDRQYLCKETRNFTCDNVASINTTGNYSETQNNSGLYVMINEITSEDEGVYWCATEGDHAPAAYRNVHGTVLSGFTTVKKNAKIEEDLDFKCEFSKKQSNNTFLCKGEAPETCSRLMSSDQSRLSLGRFTLKNKKNKIVLQINNVKAEDKGVYWFGTESSTTKDEKHMLCRLVLTVESNAFLVIVVLSVCVVLLVLLVVVLIFIKKWKGRDGAAAQTERKEEYVYEEIQTPALGKTVSTVYATAGLSQDTASVHYTAFNFPNRDKSLLPEPTSSRCEYATVFSKRKDHCTIQSLPSGEPLYSNVKK